VAAIEFALVAPVFILLLFGIITFSLVFNRQQGLHAAAREGARVGALPQVTSAQIRARVNDALVGVPLDGSPAISILPSGANPCRNRPGGDVIVTINAPTAIEIPLWGNQTVTLTGRGTFRCEV